ncbi:MAG: DoxX family membrane protein, partial [Candidatus Dadabacteria bacterium]|nr:DoxX family membrane protein [Candidatus Dadabacteria bacterium]
MISLYVLVIATAAFRIAGFLGVGIFRSFTDCLRYGFAVMFLFTGVSHFTSLKDDFVRMIPFEFFRNDATVYTTGAIEIGGAIWLASGKRVGTICILFIVFLAAVLPANIYASINNITLGGWPPTELHLRVMAQVLYIVLLAFVG